MGGFLELDVGGGFGVGMGRCWELGVGSWEFGSWELGVGSWFFKHEISMACVNLRVTIESSSLGI